MKQRLIKLLCAVECKGYDRREGGCLFRQDDRCSRINKLDMCMDELIADNLLANGVIAPPVKVGQTVWVYNQSRNNIYENKVVCIKIMGESKYKNSIVVEYRNQHGESSCRRFTWAQIGKQVFLSEKEAVEALVKGATDGKAD